MLNRPIQFFTFLFLLALSFSSCKKTEITPDPPAAFSFSVDPELVTLKKDQAFLGVRFTPKFLNAQPEESLEIIWTSENPRIASVKQDGTAWAEGAGETYIVATLASGKGVAKCKIIVTDANDYKFRLVLRDKGTSNLSIANPTAFLSPKAIARRQKQNIAIDESDLPISPAYLKAIQDIGGNIVAKSKWLNTVSVNCSDEFLIDKYKALPFVKDVVLVWEGSRTTINAPAKYVDVPQIVANHSSNTHFDYGTASTNITVNNGKILHEQGFKGTGIDIAVIDAGFINLKNNAAFKNVNIKGAKSFVYENDDPYASDTHGVWVTSTMAVNIPGTYVGTAPEANYWLLRTEDQSSEYPIEEDYWVNAAEYADSVGVDIINSSLSYTTGYGFVAARYKFEDMDGKTAFATRGANVASDKGILIVNCAGNDGTWVGTPADAPNVLTVGSVNSRLNIDAFTSWGITVDGRMKPDVLAMGGGANVINTSGIGENRSGTSYASPIMCGLAACIWQAYPTLTNKQLLEIIRKSGDRAATPEVPYGNGIADMQKAMDMARAMTR